MTLATKRVVGKAVDKQPTPAQWRLRLHACAQPGEWFGAVCVFAERPYRSLGVLANVDGEVET